MDPFDFLESATIGRRAFLKGSGLVGGALVSASLFGKAVKEVYGDPIVIPKEIRTAEAGLAAFAAKWAAAGPVIVLTRFGRFLSNKVFNVRIADDPRTYNLTLGAVGAAVAPGLNPFANATLVITNDALTEVLYGDFVGLGAFLASEAYASRDDMNKAVLLAIVFYVFAHVPAGANPDPQLFLQIMQELLQRGGLPSCAGEPSELEALDDLQADPTALLLPKATPPPVTRNVAQWMAALQFTDLRSDVVATAKAQLKSILAAMYAGSQMAPGAKTAAAVHAFHDRREASVIVPNGSMKTSMRSAALANSVAAQVLEWEDWTFLSHSGASIVPVALAVAERENRSGQDLITAIVGANELLARAGIFLTDVVHTGNALTIHQLELPLVAGKLLGLGPEQLQDALGIACTQPQVTSIPAWTADAKGMLTGWPALVGVTAAQLAAAGISGRRDILENPLGYFASVSDFAGPEKLAVFDDLPSSPSAAGWRFAAQHFNKRYPTDGFQLTTVHAVVKLVNENSIDPATVSEILVRIPLVMAGSATMFSRESPAALLDKIRSGDFPDWTYITLLFDGYYPVAAATVRRRLTWREYLPAALNDPLIASLLPKIRLEPDLTIGVFGADVKITAAGQTYETFVGCIREDVNGQRDAAGDYGGDWTPNDKLATGVGLDARPGDPSPIRTAAQLQALIEVIDDLENRSVAELVRAL
jgi:2-methylcitrate dehydratase PrpD